MNKAQLKNDLTIKEMYEAKQLLEDKLFQAVKQFEEITGCVIFDINFTFSNTDYENEESCEANGIELDVRLDNEHYSELNKK